MALTDVDVLPSRLESLAALPRMASDGAYFVKLN
jgi:hypothetical protein